ncbi:hypothetical protein HY375_02565 [Candidatus Berkelbacteria bacterium]|nr:hypothetical protein [Candidatus Berkelbacteria bacterium]
MAVQNRIPPTDGQVAKVKTQAEDALRKAGLSKDQVQTMLAKKGSELKHGLKDLFRRLGGIVNPYDDEYEESESGYPAGYRPKSVVEQLAIFALLYLGLDASHVAGLAERWHHLPDSAELLQVVPKLSAVARIREITDPYGVGYGPCLEVMLSQIGASRPFHNYRAGALTDRQVQLLAHTRQVLEQLEAETLGDYLVVPMQSGRLYAGSSVRRARWQAEYNDQWALPSWVVGHHLLVHPERLVAYEDLWIDCPGDEYRSDADGDFFSALYFFVVGGGQLGFSSHWVGDAVEGYGSASGVLGSEEPLAV